MAAINVFGGRVNKNRARFHIAQDIRGAGRIRAKALARSIGAFIEVCGEMNDDVVVCDSLDRLLVAHVETGTTRKVFSAEKISYESAEISAAAGNQSPYASIALSTLPRPRASAFIRVTEPLLPIAISISPASISDSPLRFKIISPFLGLILSVTMFSSERIIVSLSLRLY